MKEPLPLEPSTFFVRDPACLASELEGVLIVMNPTTGGYFGLEGLGAELWAWLESPQSLQSLQAHVIAEYDVLPEDAWQDIVAFMEQLWAQALIHQDATG